MAARLLLRLNAERLGLGLVGLRSDARLAGLAMDRAAWMASSGDMSHNSYGGAVYEAVALAGVSAYSSGEAIGYTTATFGLEAADYIYDLWHGSPSHWDLMTSSTFNYIGVGVAYDAGSGKTFASLVFAEAPDSSRPIAEMTGANSSGRTVVFTWSGRDGLLQTHTAGLDDFDVQYRVDGGPWSTILSHTTSTQLVLRNRPSGHTYSLRVRDRDRRNNLSPWSSIRAVRV